MPLSEATKERISKELTPEVAEILQKPDWKRYVMTENGLTVAQEEEIVNLDPNDTISSMSPEEALAHLRTLRNHEN